MTRSEAIKLAEQCGFTWLAAIDYGDQLMKFANKAQLLEREACAQACEAHAAEPQIIRETKITDTNLKVVALDCAELIRMRSDEK